MFSCEKHKSSSGSEFGTYHSVGKSQLKLISYQDWGQSIYWSVLVGLIKSYYSGLVYLVPHQSLCKLLLICQLRKSFSKNMCIPTIFYKRCRVSRSTTINDPSSFQIISRKMIPIKDFMLNIQSKYWFLCCILMIPEYFIRYSRSFHTVLSFGVAVVVEVIFGNVRWFI